eukprot:2812108-Rhodomonas_salina.1
MAPLPSEALTWSALQPGAEQHRRGGDRIDGQHPQSVSAGRAPFLLAVLQFMQAALPFMAATLKSHFRRQVHLDLSKCQIGFDEVAILVEDLQHSTHLTHLNMSGPWRRTPARAMMRETKLRRVRVWDESRESAVELHASDDPRLAQGQTQPCAELCDATF